MRWLSFLLIALLLLVQYPLWFGKGGWLRVRDSERRLAEQQAINLRLEARNQALDAEVRDLKQGYEAIEERARFELGLIREGETFVQFRNPALAAAQKQPEKSGPANTGVVAPAQP
jgi:cell division protein FtsB